MVTKPTNHTENGRLDRSSYYEYGITSKGTLEMQRSVPARMRLSTHKQKDASYMQWYGHVCIRKQCQSFGSDCWLASDMSMPTAWLKKQEGLSSLCSTSNDQVGLSHLTCYMACIRPMIFQASPTCFQMATHTHRLRIEEIRKKGAIDIKTHSVHYIDMITCCIITSKSYIWWPISTSSIIERKY